MRARCGQDAGEGAGGYKRRGWDSVFCFLFLVFCVASRDWEFEFGMVSFFFCIVLDAFFLVGWDGVLVGFGCFWAGAWEIARSFLLFLVVVLCVYKSTGPSM